MYKNRVNNAINILEIPSLLFSLGGNPEQGNSKYLVPKIKEREFQKKYMLFSTLSLYIPCLAAPWLKSTLLANFFWRSEIFSKIVDFSLWGIIITQPLVQRTLYILLISISSPLYSTFKFSQVFASCVICMYVYTYIYVSYMSVVCTIDINKIFPAKLNCPFMKSLNLLTTGSVLIWILHSPL